MFKRLWLVSVLFAFSSASLCAQNYCAVPPFLGEVVPPNILLVVDVSGSMAWSAYNPASDRIGWCESSSGCGWQYKGDEEGYFVPEKIYQYHLESTTYYYGYKVYDGYWEESPNSDYEECPDTFLEIDYTKRYKGSCLNFLLMSRIDLVRWAMVGGKPEGCSGYLSDSCDPDVACTGDFCVLAPYYAYFLHDGRETYFYSSHVKVPKSRIEEGILQQMERQRVKPRFGALFFSGYTVRDEKVYIGDYPWNGNSVGRVNPEAPYTNLKRIINYVDPSGSTPTAVALWEAYDYFKQSDDHAYLHGFVLRQGSGTLYRDPHYICGEDPSDDSSCIFAPCSKDFVILISDGQWNVGGIEGSTGYGTCTIDTGFENYSADPVVPAYRMHHDILRTLTSSDNTTYQIKVEKVYALGLFLGGTGEQSLKNVAMYGSFDLRHGDWPDDLSGYPRDYCYMDDCGNGRGSACTPLPESSLDWDADGNGVPDTFLNAWNAREIKDSLLKFIRNILRQVSSGSSVSVLSGKAYRGANLIQAVFYPSKYFEDTELTWIGYLNNLWFYRGAVCSNIREESDNDTSLGIFDDKITEFVFENNKLKLRLYTPDQTTGCVSNNSSYQEKEYDDIGRIWESGSFLSNTDADYRKIFVGVDCNGDGSVDINDSFDTSCDRKISPYLMSYLYGFDSSDIINYVRGEDLSGARNRTYDSKVWKLGDIIYSTPQPVDYGNYTVVYVGANDGMLHAFRLGYVGIVSPSAYNPHVARICDVRSDTNSCTTEHLGEEMWAFVPKDVLPYLGHLLNPDYCHLYYVDLTPYVFRYRKGNSWRTVIIGGMRLGGAVGCTSVDCVNPPDVENGKCVLNDGTLSNNCTGDTGYLRSGIVGYSAYFALDVTDPEKPRLLWEFSDPRLGFSYTGPAIVKSDDGYDVIFGSGPTDYDGRSAQKLLFFVLHLDENFNYNGNYDVIDTGINDAFSGRLFLYKDYAIPSSPVFVGYVRNNNGIWEGGVLRLYRTEDGWSVGRVIADIGPVTDRIAESIIGSRRWIFFGEGRYFSGPSDDPDAIRYLYGLSDVCWSSGTCAKDDLGNVTRLDIPADTSKGWYIQLSGKEGAYNAERIITDPMVIDNGIEKITVFVSFQPTSDICGFGGRTFVWMVNSLTGGVPKTSALGGTLLVQTSTGLIKEISELPEGGGRRTESISGVPSETAPAFVRKGSSVLIKILHVRER